LSSLPPPSHAAIRMALETILASPGFLHSERMARFLRWVVERTLAGEVATIREYAIGMAVFDRSASYDPKIDTIVRVEARRLRRKLAEYYDGPGMDDAVLIEIPGPGYVPNFAVRNAAVRALAGAAGDNWFDRVKEKLRLG
jgi:adenylate cyclase